MGTSTSSFGFNPRTFVLLVEEVEELRGKEFHFDEF